MGTQTFLYRVDEEDRIVGLELEGDNVDIIEVDYDQYGSAGFELLEKFVRQLQKIDSILVLEVAPEKEEIEWVTNGPIDTRNEPWENRKVFAGLIQGAPQATEVFSVKELEHLGLCGYYRIKE